MTLGGEQVTTCVNVVTSGGLKRPSVSGPEKVPAYGHALVVGAALGLTVGAALGLAVGTPLGLAVGAAVAVGTGLGEPFGDTVGSGEAVVSRVEVDAEHDVSLSS